MTARGRNFALLAACLLLPAGITACPPPTATGSFDDHTKPALASVDAFEQIAEQRASNTAVKFVITRFLAPGEQIRWLASDEFTLHDQWYWFRLVNDVPVDGVDAKPVDVGQRFAHVDDIDAWARGQLKAGKTLPLDLQFVENNTRLYSPHFYDLALFNAHKTLGIGTVLHFRKCADFDETWAIELEYQHVLSREELVDMFAIVERTLPPSIGDSLKILVRQPQHEQLLRQLRANHDPLADRFIHYTDVTPHTKTEVPSPGLTAGRFRVVHGGESFADVHATDVVVAEDAPDTFPAAAALLSAQPLSREVRERALLRGAPAVVRADIAADPNIDGMARVLAPVIVKATPRFDDASTSLSLVAMTEADFATYRTLSLAVPSSVADVDVANVAYTFDAASLPSLAASSALVGVDGAHLAIGAQVADAEPALFVSVRAYVEHLASLQDQIDGVVADADFGRSELARSLALEGRDGFLRRHPDQPQFAEQELAPRPASDPYRVVVEQGGVQGLIRNKPMDASALSAIASAISSGIAFTPIELRASTNVPGHPVDFSVVASTSLESAIKDVWASFWSADAFEDRKIANVSPTSGAMAIVAVRALDGAVVHARVSLAHDGLHVDTDDLGARIVDAHRHNDLVNSADRIAHAIVDARNTGVSEPLKRTTLALAIDTRNGVVDAVRPLDPPPANAPSFVRQMPIPGDVVDRAQIVEQRACDAGKVIATFTEVTDDPVRGADTGFRADPFTAFVILTFVDDVPELGAVAGQKRSAIHTQYTFAHPSTAPWQIAIDVDGNDAAEIGIAHVAYDGATLTITRDNAFSAPATCSDTVLFRTPEAFLQSVLDQSDGVGG